MPLSTCVCMRGWECAYRHVCAFMSSAIKRVFFIDLLVRDKEGGELEG